MLYIYTRFYSNTGKEAQKCFQDDLDDAFCGWSSCEERLLMDSRRLGGCKNEQGVIIQDGTPQ